MPSVLAYHRPTTLDEASALLAEPNRRAIGGGTIVVPESREQHEEGVELVDLQGLGLSNVDVTATEVRVGAMVRLSDIADDQAMPTVLAELARRELPSALRNQATVGGTVALADPESVFLAGLLAYGAIIHFHGADAMKLPQLLEEGIGKRLITAVLFDPRGDAAWAATGRTPKDTPIVAAVMLRRDNGDRTVALTGVANVPVLVDADDPTADLDPAPDFRGSVEYRRHIAAVLTRRAFEGLNQ